MINDCKIETYDADRSVTVAQPKPKRAGLLQICCKSMARINPQQLNSNSLIAESVALKGDVTHKQGNK